MSTGSLTDGRTMENQTAEKMPYTTDLGGTNELCHQLCEWGQHMKEKTSGPDGEDCKHRDLAHEQKAENLFFFSGEARRKESNSNNQYVVV